MIIKIKSDNAWILMSEVDGVMYELMTDNDFFNNKDFEELEDTIDFKKEFLDVFEHLIKSEVNENQVDVIIDKDSKNEDISIVQFTQNNDEHIVITNQEVYILNDKGQTIERIN
jgi:hypothetical protein